jgi:shikimate dehydrogenase
MATRSFKQELAAVFGQPVAENPTQVMVEAAFRHHGLDWRYLTIEVAPADLGAAVAGTRAMGFRGFNCTIPHKVAVIPFLDELGESATLMGAVNCVVRRGSKLVGENTDGKGFLESLRPLRDPHGARVLILGAGGAARAVAVELALAGARSLTVVNRTPDRARALVELLQGPVRARAGADLEASFVGWKGEARAPEGTDVVVNTTSIGLFPDLEARVPLDLSSIAPGTVVADVIPNPPRTRLVREAEARGCRVIDGLGMLVGQGRLGIQYWTGVMPDAEPMRAALEAVFGGEPPP